MKLSDWAKKQGIAYLTAYRWFKDGKLPVKAYQSDSGTIIVQDESDSSEQAMVGSPNDAMSLFLKKTVEYSKNNSSIEDFAAYVLSTFQLKLNGTNESPKYSRNRPKAEDVQKHFQQFIPKGEKPKPNSFVMETDLAETFTDDSITKVDVTKAVNPEELVKEYKQAVELGSVVAPRNYAADMFPANFALTDTTTDSFRLSSTPIVEGTVTRSVDLNTTPQQINYTGSTNSAFNNSFSSSVVVGDGTTVTGTALNSMGSVYLANCAPSAAFNSSFQPTQKELQTVDKVIETAEKPRARRGRPKKQG